MLPPIPFPQASEACYFLSAEPVDWTLSGEGRLARDGIREHLSDVLTRGPFPERGQQDVALGGWEHCVVDSRFGKGDGAIRFSSIQYSFGMHGRRDNSKSIGMECHGEAVRAAGRCRLGVRHVGHHVHELIRLLLYAEAAIYIYITEGSKVLDPG
jgi:hypothetical protein